MPTLPYAFLPEGVAFRWSIMLTLATLFVRGRGENGGDGALVVAVRR